MFADEGLRDVATLRDHLLVLRRRKWIVFLPVAVLVVGAYLFSIRQHALYAASAQVSVSQESLPSVLSGAQNPGGLVDPADYLKQQAALARSPALAARVLAAASVRGKPLLRDSSVSANQDAQLLTFRVTDGAPAVAVRLVNAYARQFRVFHEQADQAALKTAHDEVARQLSHLDPTNSEQAGLYAELLQRKQGLQTLQALQLSKTALVSAAASAPKVQPRPLRNALLGFGLGLLLGVAAAFGVEALDTRTHTALDVGGVLHVPLLARIPRPTFGMRQRNHLVMLGDSSDPRAEPYRILRTQVETLSRSGHHQVLMVTSANAREGKSTTAANLSIALARAGRAVALVDFDLRKPFLNRFFGVEDGAGVADVLLRTATVEEACRPIQLSALAAPKAATNGNEGAPRVGSLELVPAGTVPPAVADIVGSPAVTSLLAELRERAEIVIVDAPPLLGLGDAIALSSHVDALLLVTRLDTLRRPVLHELRRVVQSCSAPAIGFVLAGAEREDTYGAPAYGAYGYSLSPDDERSAV